MEGSSLPFCATYGNRSSSQGVYQFTINHELCGSKVKASPLPGNQLSANLTGIAFYLTE